MTISHGIEAASTAFVAASTTALVLTEADMGGLIVPLASFGIATVVGYFSARITMEREMGVITEREANHFKEISVRLGRIENLLDRRVHAQFDDGA